MKEVEDTGQGRKLLSAVERILADNDSLIAVSKESLDKAAAKKPASEDAALKLAAENVISHYSNRTALAGGVAAAPALIPGIGTVVAAAGGALADVVLVLKYEVEMALVLSHLHGYDIADPDERRLSFLLASVSTYEAKSGRHFFVDLAETEARALWTYGPRQASKLLLSVLTRLALLQISKGLVRAIPLVGIAVGSSVNKILTTRVGKRCWEELSHRRELTPKQDVRSDEVKAHVRKKRARKAR